MKMKNNMFSYNMYEVIIRRKKYIVVPSRKKDKKYDVYVDGKYLLSFGSRAYEHYYDRFGYYSDLNHLDKKRRKLFYARHGKTNDVKSALYWSKYLW